VLSLLPYFVVLAGVAIGLTVAFGGSQYAIRGIRVVGAALLAAALLRLALPPRYAGPLSSRGKAFDVFAFLVLGGTILGFALTLP
jgi:Protein of unknown function (DUF3017)